MDFQSMKRRELQALCKLNNIPANITNAAMADSLASLPSVEGLEEFMRQSQTEGSESPERSVLTSSGAPRTAVRHKVAKAEVEGSKMTTRTRGGTLRRGVEGTDTRKTTATRTTRKKATQEASVRKTEKDLQADFEADLDQSQVSEIGVLPEGEVKEISEEVSAVSCVVSEDQQSTESKNEAQNDGQETADDEKENPVVDSAMSEGLVEPTETTNANQKVDFHSLGRRDLQSLCKKNKLPANTTNAAMADSLDSLEIVEGLEEFLGERESQAPCSPKMSEMTSSCVRGSRTSRRTVKEPMSSNLAAKSCRGARRKVMDEIDQAKNAASAAPAAQGARRKATQSALALPKMETSQKKEVQTYRRRALAEGSAKKLEEKSSSQNAECASGINTDEDRLSVVEVEKDLQGQLEAVDPEKPMVVDCISASNVGDGLTQEAVLEKSFDEVHDNLFSDSLQNFASSEDDDGKDDEDTCAEGTVVPGQFGNLEKEICENADGDSTAEASEIAEQLGDFVNATVDDVNEDTSAGPEATEVFNDQGREFKFEDSKLGDLVDLVDSAVDPSPTEKLERNEDNFKSGDVVSEPTTQADNPLTSNSDVENDFASCPLKEQVPTVPIHVEKLEASDAGNEMAEFTSEPDQPGQADQETPLCRKSLRKLKVMLREKLQATRLAEKMDTLTLEESGFQLTRVDEDLQENVELKDESNGGPALVGESGVDGAPVSSEIFGDADNEESEDDTIGMTDSDDEAKNVTMSGDNGEKQTSITPSKSSSKTLKSLTFTPSKSSSKTPLLHDINKENVDQSASKTEPGKLKLAIDGSGKILSAMSMGMLKKEFKSLQKSEKKRPALQSRPENCFIASP